MPFLFYGNNLIQPDQRPDVAHASERAGAAAGVLAPVVRFAGAAALAGLVFSVIYCGYRCRAWAGLRLPPGLPRHQPPADYCL